MVPPPALRDSGTHCTDWHLKNSEDSNSEDLKAGPPAFLKIETPGRWPVPGPVPPSQLNSVYSDRL